MKEPLNEAENNAMQNQSPETVSQNERNAEKKDPIPAPKKKKRNAVVMLALILIFCLGFGGGFVLYQKLKSPPAKAPTETQNKTTEEVAPEPVVADDEIRGVYIATVSNINFPSKSGLSEAELRGELDDIVERSRRIGFDTLYFQARPSGDALYHSALFPTSRYLTGKEGKDTGFDPLAYLIEKASAYDMKVIAWVNPYRVTASKAETKEKALESLSDENFAKKNPDKTLFYDGKLLYDPASREVRQLIADGVKEICEGYDVAGVLFDDYFYPYPVGDETLDDSASYEAANTDLSLDDWRRDNVNQMVKLTYDTVKGVSEELSFGVSPFGIWKNASSDPRGSDTKGLEAYSQIYCDALSWIEGGYVDYISPQLYWERGNSAADFATLTRWWSAQVDGTDVKLIISHAAYRAGEYKMGGAELAQQIQYARSFMGSCGNIQYGYADISKNTAGVCDALTELYRDAYSDSEQSVATEGVSFVFPSAGTKTTDSTRFVTARSDPKYPVYSETGKVGRTKSGFLSVLMPLSMGKNTLTLTQNGVDYSLSLTRVAASSSPTTLKKFQIQSFTPSVEDGVLASSGAEIPLSVTAPRGCHVSVTLGDISAVLKPTLDQKGDGSLIKEVYEGNIAVPFISEGEEPVSAGKLFYTVSASGKKLTKEGAEVRVIPASVFATATVTKPYSYLKISPDSSFYDDYTPASVGMQDEVVASYDGYYQLAFGGFVSTSQATVQMGVLPSASVLTEGSFSSDERYLNLNLTLGAAPPLDVKVEEDEIQITLFGTETSLNKDLPLSDQLLFRSASVSYDEEKGNTLLKLKLKSVQNYYGFDHAYADGVVTFSFRKPSALSEGDAPLKGKRIVVDAGHGGTDSGALGYLPEYNEKDMNLAIALVLQQKLEALGAEVLMTRTDDTTVSLTERMDFLNRESPDLSISVHHNSVNEAKDANDAKGTLGLFWSPAGRSLAEYVQRGVPRALAIRDVGVRAQKLALCRNHRFPQTLVETDFICSPAEYEAALRGDYAELCADAMAEGVLEWYRMQEGYLKGAAS